MADGYLYKFTNGLHGSTCARKQQTHWIRFGLVCFDQWFAFAREGLFQVSKKSDYDVFGNAFFGVPRFGPLFNGIFGGF